MLCKDAGPKLVDFDDGSLDDETAVSLRRHLADCPDCRADLDTLRRWRGLATSWRDEEVPPWRPGRIGQRPWLERWLPLAASVAALTLATMVYFEQGDEAPPVVWEDPGVAFDDPGQLQPVDWFGEEGLTPMVEAMLAAHDTQRREEIEALAVLLLGVVDRQATVTEDSLRYVITQQLADQRRLDNLAQRFELASYGQEDMP
ncbi:MAG: anti-sigma factor [Gammaproteobacteria bacterium]|nr:anti-sigma factor [Gammaproteobacteria bacterium]MDE0440644.1 anti-sigma factor [Gammaproteobacteria bacterium]